MLYEFYSFTFDNFFNSCFLDCCLGREGITSVPDNPDNFTQM